MRSRRRELLSWPFVLLYLSTAGAIVLHFAAPRLGAAAWLPIAVGFVGAGAIFSIKHLSVRVLTDPKQGRWWRVLLFLFVPALTTVGMLFLDRHDIVLICGTALMSAVFLGAAIATAFDLPPLRTRRVAGRCPKCYCSLAHWPGKQCPECRWVLECDAPEPTLLVHSVHF